jgi:hypothetical protein
MESEARKLAAAVARAAREMHVAGEAAAKANHVDLMVALAYFEVTLDAWNRDLTFDRLEAEEALRSQLKFPGVEATGPPADFDLPF